MAYRRRLMDAPSYTLNHEEVAKAMEEGIRFAEGTDAGAVGGRPARACRGTAGESSGIGRAETVLPARAMLVAAGTQPNTVLAREDRRMQLDGRYFQAIDEAGAAVDAGAPSASRSGAGVLMHRAENGRL